MDALPRVLVVDDEPGVRESLRAILARDCTVYVAPTGEAALSLLTSTPIDVVTLDLRMPGMGGVALLERLRAGDRDVEAVIISGCPTDASVAPGAPFDVFGCVSKPFDVEHVRALVKAAALRCQAVRQFRETKERLRAAIGDALAGSVREILRGSAAAVATEEERRAVAEICGDDSRLVRYLEDLLFLADLRAGRISAEKQPVDLAGLLAEVVAAHRPDAAAKGLRLAAPERLRLTFRTDRRLLQRLLDALVDNAIRFTDAGEVRISVATAGATVTIGVRDSGCGLPRPIAAALSSGGSMAVPGVGLGLPMAAALAETLRGQLEARLHASAGTDLRLAIPLRETRTAAATEQEARCAP
jgi:signal transduction histidine kinase